MFGSQLHTHLRGVRVLTRHFRDGIELQELNRDDYFSQHFQEIRYLRRKPKVLPVSPYFHLLLVQLNHLAFIYTGRRFGDDLLLRHRGIHEHYTWRIFAQ